MVVERVDPDPGDTVHDLGKLLNLRECRLHGLFAYTVRQDDHRYPTSIAERANRLLALNHRLDADRMSTENLRDLCKHTRLILRRYLQVVRARDLFDGQTPYVGIACGGREPLSTRDVDQIRNHSGSRWRRAGTGTVVERRTNGVAVDDDGIHYSADLRHHPTLWHERRMNTNFDTQLRATRDREVFDV